MKPSDRDWAFAAFVFVVGWLLIGPVLGAAIALALLALIKLVEDAESR